MFFLSSAFYQAPTLPNLTTLPHHLPPSPSGPRFLNRDVEHEQLKSSVKEAEASNAGRRAARRTRSGGAPDLDPDRTRTGTAIDLVWSGDGDRIWSGLSQQLGGATHIDPCKSKVLSETRSLCLSEPMRFDPSEFNITTRMAHRSCKNAPKVQIHASNKTMSGFPYILHTSRGLRTCYAPVTLLLWL